MVSRMLYFLFYTLTMKISCVTEITGRNYVENVPMAYLKPMEKLIKINQNFSCNVSVASYLHKSETAEYQQMNGACEGGILELDLRVRIGTIGDKPVATVYVKPEHKYYGWHLSRIITEREIKRNSLADRICAVYPIAFEYRNVFTFIYGKKDSGVYSPVQNKDNNQMSFELPQMTQDDTVRKISYDLDMDTYDYSYEQPQRGSEQQSYQWRWTMKWEERKKFLKHDCAPWGYKGQYFDHKKIPLMAYKTFLPSFAISFDRPSGLPQQTIFSVSFLVRTVALSGRVKNNFFCYKFDPQVYNGGWVNVTKIIAIAWYPFSDLFPFPHVSLPWDLRCYLGKFSCFLNETKIGFYSSNNLFELGTLDEPNCDRNTYNNPSQGRNFLFFKEQQSSYFGYIVPLQNTTSCLCYDPPLMLNDTSTNATISSVNEKQLKFLDGPSCADDKCMWLIKNNDIRAFRNKIDVEKYLCTNGNDTTLTLCKVSDQLFGPCHFWFTKFEKKALDSVHVVQSSIVSYDDPPLI